MVNPAIIDIMVISGVLIEPPKSDKKVVINVTPVEDENIKYYS